MADQTGAALIAAERQRQIDAEGWTPEHDDEHTSGEMLHAASTYLDETEFHVRHPEAEFDPRSALNLQDFHGMNTSVWPWDPSWWKPSDDPVRNLVKAGALIAAEIDRLQRTVTRHG